MKPPSRRLVLIALVLAGGLGSAILLRGRPAVETSSPVRPRDRVAAVEPAARRELPPLAPRSLGARSPEPPRAGESEPLPHSLEGTDVDGWLGVDDDGHLVVTPGARWLFDYFLSATGEESADDIRSRIIAEIEKRLPPTGAREATDLLDRYLAYRERVRALQASGAAEDLQQRLAQLHDIRRETFGDANAAALFGEEEQVQAVDIQRRQVLSDQTLSPGERERQLQALDQQLPPAVRAARTEAMAVVHLKNDEQLLRATGASTQEVHALREQRFGAEAADRLDALDRERAAWQQRLDDYRRARRATDDNAGLTPEARAQAIESLRSERFTPEERVRVEALDGG